MVTDDITQRRLFYGAVHADQMIETFVSLRVLRRLETRQHDGYLVGDTHGVAHLMIRCAGVYVQTMYANLACRGVEVLKLQLTYRAAIHCVSKFSAEFLHVEMVCSAANLFVRREAYAYLAMLNFGMLKEVLHSRHDLCDAGFIVGT